MITNMMKPTPLRYQTFYTFHCNMMQSVRQMHSKWELEVVFFFITKHICLKIITGNKKYKIRH